MSETNSSDMGLSFSPARGPRSPPQPYCDVEPETPHFMSGVKFGPATIIVRDIEKRVSNAAAGPKSLGSSQPSRSTQPPAPPPARPLASVQTNSTATATATATAATTAAAAAAATATATAAAAAAKEEARSAAPAKKGKEEKKEKEEKEEKEEKKEKKLTKAEQNEKKAAKQAESKAKRERIVKEMDEKKERERLEAEFALAKKVAMERQAEEEAGLLEALRVQKEEEDAAKRRAEAAWYAEASSVAGAASGLKVANGPAASGRGITLPPPGSPRGSKGAAVEVQPLRRVEVHISPQRDSGTATVGTTTNEGVSETSGGDVNSDDDEPTQKGAGKQGEGKSDKHGEDEEVPLVSEAERERAEQERKERQEREEAKVAAEGRAARELERLANEEARSLAQGVSTAPLTREEAEEVWRPFVNCVER